jgi:hypothetical protein
MGISQQHAAAMGGEAGDAVAASLGSDNSGSGELASTMEKRTPSDMAASLYGSHMTEEEPVERDTGLKLQLKKLLGIVVFRKSYLDLARVQIDPAERYVLASALSDHSQATTAVVSDTCLV